MPSAEPPIQLSQVVKKFGPIAAVNGLDLEVPAGICLGLLGPNGAGKSTTMRLLTGQAIADSGDRGCSASNCRVNRRRRGPGWCGAAARQPRHRRHRGGEPCDLRPALPGRGRRRAAVDRPSRWPASPTGAKMPSTSSPAGCAGACCSPGGWSTIRDWSCSTSRPWDSIRRSGPRTLDLDRQTEFTRGTTILMSTHYIEEAERLADEVAIMSADRQGDRRGRPRRADRRARRRRGRRGLRAAGAPGRGGGRGEAAGLRTPPDRRSPSSLLGDGRARDPFRGRHPAGQRRTSKTSSSC